MKIKISCNSPNFKEWRKWRLVKPIKEGEIITNAIVGYKKNYGWLSIYIFPILFVIHLDVCRNEKHSGIMIIEYIFSEGIGRCIYDTDKQRKIDWNKDLKERKQKLKDFNKQWEAIK